MKSTLLILLIFSISIIAWSQSDVEKEFNAFPDFPEVWDYVFEDLDADTLGFIGLARRPTGWYLRELDEISDLKNEYLIWSPADRIFLVPDFVAEGFEVVEPRKSYSYKALVREFAIHPYFGYKGWDLDVIERLGEEKVLSDSLLYGLARAYDNYTSGLLRAQYYFHLSPYTPAKYEKVDEERLALIKQYTDHTIIAFRRLFTQNPDFVTIVGKIDVKLANIYMDAWLRFMTIKEENLAATYLVDIDYPEFWLNYARNLLDNVDKNGILFTYGDNDTYPLWYVQQKNGYRTDVKVLNLPLLNRPEYIDMVLDKEFKNRLKLYISDSSWYNAGVSYVIFKEGIKENQILDSLLTYCLSQEYYLIINAKEATLTFGSGDRMQLEFPAYLRSNQLAVLDILASSNATYPVHYSMGAAKESYALIKDYLRNDGMTWRLLNPSEMRGSKSKYVDTDVLYRYVIRRFDDTGLEEINDSSELIISSQYMYMYSSLAFTLAKEKKQRKFLKIVKLYDQAFPSDRVTQGYNGYQIVLGYYWLGLTEEGSQRMEQLLMGLIDYLKNPPEYVDQSNVLSSTMSTYDPNNLLDYGIKNLVLYGYMDAAKRVQEARESIEP